VNILENIESGMNLENSINKAVGGWSKFYPIETQTTKFLYGFRVSNWEKHICYYPDEYWPEGTLEGFQKRGLVADIFSIVHLLIRQAPLVDCLTSPSEYIREYKIWYERSKDVHQTSNV